MYMRDCSNIFGVTRRPLAIPSFICSTTFSVRRSLILACFETAAFLATTFAFSSDLIFAARFVSSFAASSASKDVFWNDFGMSEVKPNASD